MMCPPRKKRLLSSGAYADVHFLVGEGDEKELLSAHKAILISASDVFEAMFRFDDGNATKTTSNCCPCDSADHPPVEVTDIGVDAFKAMLDFIYTGDSSGLNGDNLFAVLYAANKYGITGLVKECRKFPMSKLANVFSAVGQAHFLSEKELTLRCLAFIDLHADRLLQTEAFLQIDQQFLCELLDRDHLNTDGENAIWNAALRWADEQCRRNGMDCSGTNRRVMLGPALHKIRIPLISQEEFAKNIVPSNVLTKDEVIGVYQHHWQSDSDGGRLYALQFPTQRRVFDSRSKKEGKLLLKIEKLSEFAREDEDSRRCSDAVFARALPWSIMAIVEKKCCSTNKYLGFFLSPRNLERNLSYACSATMRIVAQKAGAADHIRCINHTFCAKEFDWGFKHFMSFEELMDPSNGWHNDEEDSVTLAIDFTVEEPSRIE